MEFLKESGLSIKDVSETIKKKVLKVQLEHVRVFNAT